MYNFVVAGADVAGSGPAGVVVSGSLALTEGDDVSLLVGSQQSPACGNAGGSFVASGNQVTYSSGLKPLFGALLAACAHRADSTNII